MEPIPDIGEVTEGFSSSGNETPFLEKYRSCLKCKGKVDPADDDILGTYGTMQRLSKCSSQLTANIVVQSSTSYYNFQVLGDFLQAITASNDVTRDALLKAPLLHLPTAPPLKVP